MNQTFSSDLLNKAVEEFAKLPGIGHKTAMRLVLHLLKLDENAVDQFANSLTNLRHNVHYCNRCHNISDTPLCPICANPNRDETTICVVENYQDVLAIEATTQFHGTYHVLGGLISPLENVSPSDLQIASLLQRIQQEPIKEILLALSSTLEGDTTNFFIYRKLKDIPGLTITTLSRGISINDELQYIDEVTLGRAIISRVPFQTNP